MKNYTNRLKINEMGYRPKGEREYTDLQTSKMRFIRKMDALVRSMNCGWAGVYYAVAEKNGDEREYMVLHNETLTSERWIPIDGNNDACNFAVLGENLF